MADDWQKAAKAASEAASEKPPFPFTLNDVDFDSENLGAIADAGIDRGNPYAETLMRQISDPEKTSRYELGDLARRLILSETGGDMTSRAVPIEDLRRFKSISYPESYISSMVERYDAPSTPEWTPAEIAEHERQLVLDDPKLNPGIGLMPKTGTPDGVVSPSTEAAAKLGYIAKWWDTYGPTLEARFPNTDPASLRSSYQWSYDYIQELKRIAGPNAKILLGYLGQYGLGALSFYGDAKQALQFTDAATKIADLEAAGLPVILWDPNDPFSIYSADEIKQDMEARGLAYDEIRGFYDPTL